MISMYHHKLHLQISCGSMTSRLFHMAYAIQVTVQKAEEAQKKVPMHSPVDILT